MTHLRNGGPVPRKSYARIRDVYELPRLIEVQLDSFRWFQTEGLQELFSEISPIVSFNKNLELHFGSQPIPGHSPRRKPAMVSGSASPSTPSPNVAIGT